MREIYAEYPNFNYFLSGYTTIFENVASFEATKVSNDSQDTIVAELNETSMRLIFEPGRSFYVFDIPGGIANVQSIANAIFALMQANQTPQDVNITNTALPIDDSPPINVTVSNPFAGNVVLDPSTYDAFGRLRVSEPKTLFECSFEYDAQPLMFDAYATGAATITHNNNHKMVTASATTGADKAVFQSKQYINYQAGKSLLAVMTGILTTNIANTGTTRIGYFDSNADKTMGVISGNGIFFKCTAGSVGIVLRSYTSGGQLDAETIQTSWNVDKLDGTGASGVTIDWSKTQIFWFQLQWLGAGKVKCGVCHNGQFITAHEFNNNNTMTVPYMQSANLPMRWEATTTAGQTAECKAICASVVSEGGYSIRGKFRSFNNGFTGSVFGATLVPILTIRKKSTYNRMTINLVDANLNISSNDTIGVQFIINGTTGGTYTSIAADSAIEQCIGTTGGLALSGGIVVSSRVFQNDLDTLVTRFENNIKLWSKIAGESDTFTMAARNLTGGTANIFYTLGWQEWF